MYVQTMYLIDDTGKRERIRITIILFYERIGIMIDINLQWFLQYSWYW